MIWRAGPIVEQGVRSTFDGGQQAMKYACEHLMAAIGGLSQAASTLSVSPPENQFMRDSDGNTCLEGAPTCPSLG